MLPHNDKAAKRSCLILSILIFVVLPFSMIALGLLLWFGRESFGRSQLKARIASLAKQGYPVDNASVESQYRDRADPTHTNAWLDLLNTVTSPDFNASSKGIPYLGIDVETPILKTDDWEEEEVTHAFLEKWKSLHAEVLRLSVDAKPVRFPIVFKSFATLLPETHNVRQLARLLQLHGRVGLRARDSAKVRDAIDGLLGQSRVNADEPFLVSQLVSMAIDGIAIGLLKDAIQHDALSESDLLVLLPKVLASTTIGKEWQTAIAGERGTALLYFQDPKEAQLLDVRSFPARSRDGLFYIELTQEVAEIPTEDIVEFKTKLADIESKLKAKAAESWLSRFDTILTLQITPAFSAAGDAFIRRALQHRIAALAIGIRIYEDRHGKFPKSLDDLSALPMDVKQLMPTINRTFGYRLDGENARLWGGTYQDAFSIPDEPPSIIAGEPDNTGKAFWNWEFLDRK